MSIEALLSVSKGNCSRGKGLCLIHGNFSIEINVSTSMGFDNFVEEVQVLGRDLVDKVRDLIHEGNVQRIVIKDESGNTFVEIPVTVAAIGAILSPILAALGAISA